MLIVPINDQFRIHEIPSHVRNTGEHVRRFIAEEWCPIVEKWVVKLTGDHFYKIASKDETPISDDNLNFSVFIEKILKPIKAILIAEEKYATTYYDASTTEAIGMTSLYLIGQRNDLGYYQSSEMPEKPDIPDRNNLPKDEDMARLILQKWKSYDNSLMAWKDNEEQMSLLKQSLEENDYVAAFRLLELRNDYEYERVTFKKLTVIKGKFEE